MKRIIVVLIFLVILGLAEAIDIKGINPPAVWDSAGHRDTIFTVPFHLFCQFLNGQATLQYQLKAYKGDTNASLGAVFSNDGINYGGRVVIDSLTREGFYYYDLSLLHFQDWEYIKFWTAARDTTVDTVVFRYYFHFGRSTRYY